MARDISGLVVFVMALIILLVMILPVLALYCFMNYDYSLRPCLDKCKGLFSKVKEKVKDVTGNISLPNINISDVGIQGLVGFNGSNMS